MREIRPSGSEGGAGLAPRSYLYRGAGILPAACNSQASRDVNRNE